MGRSPTCLCGTCPKCKRRVKQREKYQAMSQDERRAMVARRDPEKVKRADRDRYYRDRENRLALSASYDKAHPEKGDRKKRWAEANPQKRRAQVAVSNAIRDGRLTKGACAKLDETCYGRIEAHHEDYDKPLDVTWLCSGHHGETRRVERAGPEPVQGQGAGLG